KHHRINFGGKLFTKCSKIEKLDLVIVGRESNVEKSIHLTVDMIENAVKKRFGLHRYKYNANINLNEVFKSQLFNADIYDVFFDIKYHDYEEVLRVRIGNPRFRARIFTNASRGERENTIFAASPYYTVKRFNLSLQIDSFKRETYNYLK